MAAVLLYAYSYGYIKPIYKDRLNLYDNNNYIYVPVLVVHPCENLGRSGLVLGEGRAHAGELYYILTATAIYNLYIRIII